MHTVVIDFFHQIRINIWCHRLIIVQAKHEWFWIKFFSASLHRNSCSLGNLFIYVFRTNTILVEVASLRRIYNKTVGGFCTVFIVAEHETFFYSQLPFLTEVRFYFFEFQRNRLKIVIYYVVLFDGAGAIDHKYCQQNPYGINNHANLFSWGLQNICIKNSYTFKTRKEVCFEPS